MSRPLPPDPWTALRQHTQARIALGRAGNSLPTRELLAFGLAHAQARDAVHQPLDLVALAAELATLDQPCLEVASQAGERSRYLQRPDLGRRLDCASAARLAAQHGDYDLVIVIGDGLSALAVARQAAATLAALLPRLAGWRLAPLVLASQARVALADEVGELLGARQALILLGERPGLSSPDSLGAYLTHGPRLGRSDAERNCVSNIRPEGLPPAEAARKLAWLLHAARRLGLTGVGLKDDSASLALATEPVPDPVIARRASQR